MENQTIVLIASSLFLTLWAVIAAALHENYLVRRFNDEA